MSTSAAAYAATSKRIPPKPKAKTRTKRRTDNWLRTLDLTRAPLILMIPEMASIYRISESSLRKRLWQGRFEPRPFARGPYRWRRVDVQADLTRPTRSRRRRPH